MSVDPKPGITVVQPTIHRDVRGNFVEVHHAERLAQLGVNVSFVQDNYSPHYAMLFEAWTIRLSTRRENSSLLREAKFSML